MRTPAQTHGIKGGAIPYAALVIVALIMGISAAQTAYAADELDDGPLTAAQTSMPANISTQQECKKINVDENDVALYGLDGSRGMLSDVCKSKKHLIIVGRYGCLNTRSAVSQALSLSRSSQYSDFDFLVFDVDNDADSFRNYESYQTDRVRFFTGADYDSWAFGLYGYGSVSLPFLFAIDTDGSILLMGTGSHVVSEFIGKAWGIGIGDDDGEDVDDGNLVQVSPNVTARSQAQVIARMAKDDVMLGINDEYAVEPVLNTKPGELSDETKTLGLGMLNTIRYIAGLDDVTLDADYGKKAQAAAFVNEAIGVMTHYPDSAASKPSGMSDDVWKLACEGAANSNLAWGNSAPNLSRTVVHGWMSDADGSNVSKVGHRRWCLNPAMSATGFGGTEYYHAMYSADQAAKGMQTNVVWPAQNMPYEFFNAEDPWSISVGEPITKPSKVKVTLTRKSDGKVWTFENADSSNTVYNLSKCFYIDDGLDGTYIGQPGCIIFRPDGVTYKAGDEYHVEAANVNGTKIVYDVKFFEGFAGYHASDPSVQSRL